MHWILLTLINGALHSIYFDDYQSCINAGNQLRPAGQLVKFVCVQE